MLLAPVRQIMKIFFLSLFSAGVFIFPAFAFAIEELTLGQLLQRTFDNYPDMILADLDVEHARQELPQRESQIGLMLRGKSGYSRDLSFIGTPSDNFSVAAELNRMLKTGGRVGLSASYRREDNSGGSFFRGYPNPANNINIDLSYRKPFWRGEGNPEFNQGLIIAGTQVDIARENRRERQDQLASQVIDLFYSALFTYYRIENSQHAIDRARRLKKYIEKKVQLGLAEEKDRLQAEARLRSELASWRSLQVIRKQQRVALNRFSGESWDNEIRPLSLLETFPLSATDIDSFVADAELHSPALRRGQGRLEIARAMIEQRRNARRDTLDLVVSAGIRNLAGDTGGDSVDKTDFAGGVNIEYQRALDRRGFDAALYQTQLERDRVLQEMKNIRYQLRYRISSLVAEIVENRETVQSHEQRLASEMAKYRESERLYRDARLDTGILIQHEAELQAAELALQQQRVELLKRYAMLALLRGKLYP